PPPIPSPRQPAGSRAAPPAARTARASAPPPVRASAPAPLDDEPTNVADDLRGDTERGDPTVQTQGAPDMDEDTGLRGGYEPPPPPGKPHDRRLPLKADVTGAKNAIKSPPAPSL